MIAFGPIPSRRLGQSLGINHIPPKHCSYDCVYCQVGPTPRKEQERRTFYPVSEVVEGVTTKVREAEAGGIPIDYLTFVPDGEPGLDLHLGEMIDALRPLGYKIAVISNSSLLSQAPVREHISRADWVSLKVDSLSEENWKKINRPHEGLSLSEILSGIRSFTQSYSGVLCTETMLVQGIQRDMQELEALADFLAEVSPQIAYLGVPTRPPAESWAQVPDEAAVLEAYQVFSNRLPRVELLLGYPETPIQAAGDPRQNLLAITSVHPLQEKEAHELLRQAGSSPTLLEVLLKEGELKQVKHKEKVFFVRRLPLSGN